MKYKNPISFLILLLLFVFSGYSQNIVNRANSSYTVQDSRFSAALNLYVPRYADTTEANLSTGIDSSGAVIYTYSTNSLWYRSAEDGKKWVEVGGGGGSGTVTSVGSGFGLLGGPITTTGTLDADSTVLGTKQWVYNILDSLPDPNLVVQNWGSGISLWGTSNDTLYFKRVKNTTFISASTDTDSSLLVSLSATGTPSSSTYLRGDNTWATIGGGGDVTKVGTPVNNQLGIWTGDGTIEGDANLTFASSTLNIGVAGASTGLLTLSGVTSGTITIQPASAAGTYTLTLPTTDGESG
ncbi:MAG TPA: hypothetical protein PKV73_01045 [Agriterribacter sp.]|nr:hypothetical protein [Agriterribacter sp.]